MIRMMVVDMDDQQCVAHLTAASFGRLGVVVNGKPEIFPVHHAYDPVTGCVVFQTNTRTKLHAAMDWPSVAFEVDGLDPDHEWGGWSVLIVGRAEEITDREEISRAARLHPTLWGSDDSERWIRIVPEKMTGRYVTRIPAEEGEREDVREGSRA
ncbi:MAG TPA: pyridoxamine 5'-phosphate oxidase family protein [Acidimicrobiales bacterium]